MLTGVITYGKKLLNTYDSVKVILIFNEITSGLITLGEWYRTVGNFSGEGGEQTGN